VRQFPIAFMLVVGCLGDSGCLWYLLWVAASWWG
jgi:hypothetical protein